MAEKVKVFICKVCSKEFINPQAHLENTVVKRDYTHSKYIDRVILEKYELPCICGGRIKKYEYASGGYDIECTNCKLQFDSR